MPQTSIPGPLWSPPAAAVEAAALTAFLRQVVTGGAPIEVDTEPGFDPAAAYAALHHWSVARPADFWSAVWRFTDVVASMPATAVVDDPDRMPGARWFSGARLNFAENLLRHATTRPEADAIVAWNEEGHHQTLSFGALRTAVAHTARALAAEGVGPGDRVAGFMPNLPETVIAMLASASLGATWSSCSPDFGLKGVLDRFGQIEPTVLFVADGYRYAGKHFDLASRIRGILESIPSIRRAVVVPYAGGETVDDPRCIPWPDFLARDRRNGGDDQDGDDQDRGDTIDFAQLPFDHPLYIMYSSGTTGLPKCLVHGAGGTLLQHLKELVLHTDLGPNDRIFYFTTCGWMMWNWLVSSLATGAAIVLYDGAPMKPKPILWDLAEQERLTVFGTSAKYLAIAEKEGLVPRRTHQLDALDAILSTGSPLAPEGFDYVYRDVKPDVRLSSISGGTDIVSCFALGNPILPVHPGELQSRGLGMAVDVLDEHGESVVGEAGELVCRRAFPSMPIGFWGDDDGSRYHDAYFDRYEGIWTHGDWAELTPRGGMIIHGRSDATLNPGGVRIGTAEIYRQVEQLDSVLESLVIGQRFEDDVRVVLFVRLVDGETLDQGLEDQIRKHVRTGASPHHVPRKIVQVADLPRTLSGKLTELAVRDVVHGRPIKNRDALANPEALDLFRDLPALRD